jgi:poly-gamma-glutamate synthesis protein (capsule biosynthesis protein)
MKLKYLNYRKLFLLFCFVHVLYNAQSQEDTINKISLLFIGDIMGHDSQIASAENRTSHEYSYDTVFSYIKPIISEADVAIANLEVTLDGRPYMGYPQFSSPAALAVACKNAGIDYFVTANNHAADRGRKGIRNTIARLDSIGIPHTGTYLSLAARDTLTPLIINKKGFSIALLNYTYATNGIIVPPPVIVDSLDKEKVLRDIQKAKSKNPDAVILFLHWGTEYDTIPAKAQTQMAELFLKSGADLVIGSHPHVLQKMVWMKDKETGKDGVVVYSLGNFVSNQRKPKTDGGSIVKIELTKGNNSVKVSKAGFYLTWVYTPIVDFRLQFYILPCSQFEDRPEFFSTDSQYTQMKTFIKQSRALLETQNLGIGEYVFDGNAWVLTDKK